MLQGVDGGFHRSGLWKHKINYVNIRGDDSCCKPYIPFLYPVRVYTFLGIMIYLVMRENFIVTGQSLMSHENLPLNSLKVIISRGKAVL